MESTKENWGDMKRRVSVPLLSALTLGVATAAFAGSTYAGFSTTVGAYNGSGYTSYQTKAISGARGNVITTSVGGSYKVDARMQSSSGTGDWQRNLTDGDSRELQNNISARKLARVQFSNDLTTRVSVQVAGSWRSR